MTNEDRMELFYELGKDKNQFIYKGIIIDVTEHYRTIELTPDKYVIVNKMMKELKRGISVSKKTVDEYLKSIIDEWDIPSVSAAKRYAKLDTIGLNVTDWNNGNATANIWYNAKSKNQNEKFFGGHSLDWYVTIKQFKFDDNPKLVKPQLEG